MNFYNPMIDYQRNNLMAQQQMIQNQLNQMSFNQNAFNPYTQPTQPQFIVRPVGGIEEVNSVTVDPGMIYLFPNRGTGEIYLKRFNTNNGKSEVIVYPAPETESVEQSENINSRLKSIEQKLGELYESISNNANFKSNCEKSNRGNSSASNANDAKTKSSEVQSDNAND